MIAIHCDSFSVDTAGCWTIYVDDNWMGEFLWWFPGDDNKKEKREELLNVYKKVGRVLLLVAEIVIQNPQQHLRNESSHLLSIIE